MLADILTVCADAFSQHLSVEQKKLRSPQEQGQERGASAWGGTSTAGLHNGLHFFMDTELVPLHLLSARLPH